MQEKRRKHESKEAEETFEKQHFERSLIIFLKKYNIMYTNKMKGV